MYRPLAMSVLFQNLHHYYRSLGGWTFAFNDYYALNFTADLDSPYIKAMADIIDPICKYGQWFKQQQLKTIMKRQLNNVTLSESLTAFMLTMAALSKISTKTIKKLLSNSFHIRFDCKRYF